MKNRTDAAYQFLVDRWHWFMEPSDAPESYNRLLFLGILDEFTQIHGEEATQALAGFIVFAFDTFEDNDKAMGAIRSTVGHDLGGRSDKVMLPRSHSYLRFWEGQFTA